MRIAFVAQPFDRMTPPVQGGSLAIWIYQVARRCAARGHDTFILANDGGTVRARRTRYEQVEYIHDSTAFNSLVNRAGDALARVLGRLRGQRPAPPTFAAAWRDFGYGLKVGLRLRRLGCDAVLIMNYSQLVPIVRWLHPRCKIYLYMQCEWLTQLDRRMIEPRVRAADIVGGNSEYIRRKIAAHFPQHDQKCVTLNNAATPASGSDSKPEPHLVLFVGRVSPEKGIHVLVAAFHEVLARFPSARLEIVGGFGSAPLEFLVGLSDDPLVAALRRFYEVPTEGKDPYLAHLEAAAGQELGRRIVFTGHIDHEKTAAAYRRASVLVNPSLSESFGMSLVEAMMHRVPVVASQVGGMPYIVDDGVTGRLVPPDDAPSLAKAICQVLGDEEHARQMGEAGRRRALEQFSWDRTAEVFLEQLAKR